MPPTACSGHHPGLLRGTVTDDRAAHPCAVQSDEPAGTRPLAAATLAHRPRWPHTAANALRRSAKRWACLSRRAGDSLPRRRRGLQGRTPWRQLAACASCGQLSARGRRRRLRLHARARQAQRLLRPTLTLGCAHHPAKHQNVAAALPRSILCNSNRCSVCPLSGSAHTGGSGSSSGGSSSAWMQVPR